MPGRTCALARTGAELDALVAEIRARGGTASALVCEVTDTAALDAAFARLERLDVLVNNAGSNRPQPFLDVDVETLDWLLELNIRAAFIAAQRAARLMQRTGGVIINMSSQMGHVGSPNRTVYCATKHAIEGLTKAMAVDLASKGIRVVSIAPTFVKTPLSRTFLADPAFNRFVLDKIALGRIAALEEIAAAVVYLASPAAGSVTGSSLLVDGGWTAA
jgi:NAD(P)-dependent dehydrogenase (short-subunit alcohol dehydrogenase family)